MASNLSKETNPLQNIFIDIKKILDTMEVKDLNKATSNEPADTALTEMWLGAYEKKDTYLTYHKFWSVEMFQKVNAIVSLSDVKRWMKEPYKVPLKYRDALLEEGRQAFFDSYEEPNEYYRTLNGLPPLNEPESSFIFLSEETRKQLRAPNEPVHKLSTLIQNNYMGTEEYQEVLKKHPDKKYLKYLGNNKIDIYRARKAKDFEIIRYPTGRSDINPNLLSIFASTYNDYREYVMVTLYNDSLKDVYTNYREFMGLVILLFTLLQVASKTIEATNNQDFLDDTVLHIILSSYGISESLLLTNDIRRKLVASLFRLVREKGTDEVYYDLVKIMGYQDVVVSKLMLMKGQQFDDKGKALDKYDPYFLKVNINDDNIYESISSGNVQKMSYHDVVDSDPTWWDMADTRKVLQESSYSMSDSKYIVVEAAIRQMKEMFETIYFLRMVLDNKTATDTFEINIPELFGTESMSIYDLAVFVLSATCMANGLSGQIESDYSKLLATAGFNFDIDVTSFVEFLNTTKYVDVERVMNFIGNISITEISDIGRVMNSVIYPMREWLELKISRAENRKEYLEYESIYRALYTYDLTRNSFLSDFMLPMESIRKKYELTDSALKAYQHFYPRSYTGTAITVNEFPTSRYRGVFSSEDGKIDWWIHIVLDTIHGEDDRGYVYFHDILNSPDLRELTNPDGTRVFMDYEDEEIGWQVNTRAVDKAIELISKLDEDMLRSAKFQVDTPIAGSDGEKYTAGSFLPASIRAGIFKDILKDKIIMDMSGLAVPATTYAEYLYRKNPTLFNLLVSDNRFERNREAWLNDVMKVVLALETELDLHMKYFEQTVAGPEMFFKPLITLIKHFKSTFVNIIKTGISYQFGDKIDAGGNSNMFKLFDEVNFVVHFVVLASNGYSSQFGLFDTEHKCIHKVLLKDLTRVMNSKSNTHDRSHLNKMGSIHMSDEMIFFKNGKQLDPDGQHSYWQSGEPGSGRWSEEDDILMATRDSTANIKNLPVDMDGWKDFVKSYIPSN